VSSPSPDLASSAARGLGATWDDLLGQRSDRLWRHIRALRHRPPGHAGRGNRRKVFSAALEQAEQLFAAAAAVDYAARPILLFYGLSQAGRAIAAAATAAEPDSWKLTGHGVTVRNLAQSPPLHQLAVQDAGLGSFTQLATLLSSGSLPQGVDFGQLWATIPSLLDAPLDIGDIEYRPVLSFDRSSSDARSLRGWVNGLPIRFSDWTTEDQIDEFLSCYPSLAGHGPDHTINTAKEPNYRVDESGMRIAIAREWIDSREPYVLQGYYSTPESVSDLTQPYRGDDDRWVFPTLGGSDKQLNPLLAWWAILFTLSMLARYEPASWTMHLDVDSSANAIPLETVLVRALEVCPELIYYTIQAASSGTETPS
jgi:YaaC-like Protein